ncbi:MAG TPA: polymer-forming cytoskeletal protein [Dongiaceae bacterium]|nr:polymer-forming cytoskeletal protein [Dongiaceae bacterium]
MMWDKKETGARTTPESGVAPVYTPEPIKTATTSGTGRAAIIGPSIQIKGELQGDEDLTIDGRVEGKIELREHNLTIGQNGRIKADLFARNIVIAGEVTGNAFAAERVEIAPSGRLSGDITSPRITIADGAHFKGAVDMERGAAKGAGARDEVRRMPDAAAAADTKHQPRL